MVGAVAAAMAVAVQVTRTVACADGPEIGRAYFYDPPDDQGNCSLPSAGRLFVSVSTGEYAGSAACGGYLDVTGPLGTVRVQVVDQCTTCRDGELDLSRTAFAKIAKPDAGVTGIVYSRVRNPRVAKPLAFRVKTGSSTDWMAVQIIDHGNPLRSVRVLDGPHWRDLRRSGDNYWIFDHRPGPGPFTIRVTDVYGHRATTGGVDLSPGVVQRGTRRLYGQSAVTPVTPQTLPSPFPARAPAAAPSPAPTGSVFC
ncbi:hypothetical protein Aph01nite_38830 [Acrocarpospora phusangensis]|uniref:Expansin-like EG45 domain-containing protein n=1 Tax=Acrocarpospora phusangensis TaxID=1070424 RepID=A0A919QDQ3_9ACTN|nr:expansin EXLX1 family cellulose-binding protein [Acrocarpospora phusangensis]GIH25573.1 hypothetical protein Aph01nite_38830 [Acrocarpospora phusangensis]